MFLVKAYYRVENKKKRAIRILKMHEYPTLKEQWLYALETAVLATGDNEILDSIQLITRR